jgi:hypothetical protein
MPVKTLAILWLYGVLLGIGSSLYLYGIASVLRSIILN